MHIRYLIKIFIIAFGLWFLLYALASSVYLNVTKSERIGYYFAYKWFEYKVGDIVLICLDNVKYSEVLHKLGLFATQSECSDNMPFLLKSIVAKSGDRVNITKYGIYINNVLYKDSKILSTYKGINLLAQKTGLRILKTGEYFVLGNTSTSYDSRYFGIIHQYQIYKKALFLQAVN